MTPLLRHLFEINNYSTYYISFFSELHIANPLIFYAFNSFQSLKHNNEAKEAPKMLLIRYISKCLVQQQHTKSKLKVPFKVVLGQEIVLRLQ